MPGIHDLELFREELTRLGDERAVTAQRGETFEELPLPAEVTPESANIDVESLISSLGAETPSVPEAEAPSFEAPSFEAPSFEGPPPFPGDTGLPGGDESSGDLSALDDLLASLDLGETPSPESGALGPDSVSIPPEGIPDFNDLGGLGEDLEAMDSIEPPAAEPAADLSPEDVLSEGLFNNLSEPGELDISNDFSIPDGLLTGFADEIEAERQSAPDSAEPSFDLEGLEALDNVEPSGDTDFSEMDFTPDFEGIERRGAPGEDEAVAEPLADLDDALESVADEGADIPEIEDMDVPSMDFDLPDLGSTPGEPGAEGFGVGDALDGLGDFKLDALELGTEEGAPAAPDIPSMDEAIESMGDFSDMSLPEDFSFPGEGPEGAAGGSAELDGFEGFSLDEDFLKNTIDSVGDEEFHIPGFADFASGSFDQNLADISSAARPSGGARKEVPDQISDEDLERLFATIAKYPLNLRIGVEEYIAGDAGTDRQKMELVHSILRDTPLRKIAHILSDALGRTIDVPKDFEKKTFADLEEEKSSLRYVFFNKVLPIFTMAAIVAVLLSCTAYLSYQFIYRPLAAESLYRRGYAAIDSELYTQSLDLFNQAIVKWEKKNWYFKYAEAYRGHRQYILAERMYLALLARYDNDKKAGLDYAGMLLNDLRNFEKAESVIRRRVLDNYVNDPDGLMLLGDNFLEWADEDPTKFEEARKSYATLIELYGEKDPYLARMLRYFIRTDNLAEVLPLKDRFLPKRSKIEARDLVELGGYLVDKRYEPNPGDNEALRERIEDLRAVLERAVKADETIPEAHYNMGRFLIYNYYPDLAYRALDHARGLFEKAPTMTPRRVLTRVDTFRLMGELRQKDGEYLDALDLYARGIDLYERQRENGSVRQDRRVGLLYADSADIDYFLVDDYGSALGKYESAIAELYDTPSIRYRVGFLEYRGGDYGKAYDSFLLAHADLSEDRNVLYALGNTLMHRDDIFLAQGYYELLMGSLDAEKLRKGVTFPSSRADFRDFVEEYVKGSNNLGVALYRIAERNGDSKKYARAAALFAESIRASDSLTRDQVSMVRSGAQALAALNLRNMSHPKSEFKPEIYVDIPQLMQGETPLKQREDR